MVNIRTIELFDYIKLHNEVLCKKIYRIEISNLPYTIYRSDLYEIHKMLWYINYKYNVVGYKGSIVTKLLNNNLDYIMYNSEGYAKMTPTNYIDFEMSNNEYEDFTIRYSDTLRTVYYLSAFNTGLVVNKKGIIHLIADIYDIPLTRDIDYTDESKEYEIHIKNKYYLTPTGYLKNELGIDKIIRNDTYYVREIGPGDIYSYENYIYDVDISLRKNDSDTHSVNNDTSYRFIKMPSTNTSTIEDVLSTRAYRSEVLQWFYTQDEPNTIFSPFPSYPAQVTMDAAANTNTTRYFDGNQWVTVIGNGREA